MKRLPRPFEALLRVLPEGFRDEHREGITELLDVWGAERGALGRVALWARAALDVVVVGVSLRLAAVREHRGEGRTTMDGLRMDIAFAARALRRRPGFTAVAVLTLALGIGANTAIFSVVNGVLLRPLPYAAAERIGMLWHEFGDGAQNLPALHALDARDYRDRSTTFEDVTVAGGREWILGVDDDAELVDVGTVEAGFFEFFGATPLLGRTFTPEEDVPGATPVVMLSHRLWVRRFGADPEVVGRAIDVAGTTMEVVGILPASFRLFLPAEAFRLRDAELWATLRLDPARQPPRNYTGYTGFVRLREGVTFAQAQEELEVMEGQLKAEHPEHAASNLQARVVPLLRDVVKGTEGTLTLLFGAVGFVLLIACANVANLVLVRGHARGPELSLRAALGAGRGGLVRLAMAESALLSLAGATLGIALAAGILRAVQTADPGSVPRLDAVSIDGRALAFAVGITALSTLLFGLLPALRNARRDPGEVLNAEVRGGGHRLQRRFRNALVVGEVAASLVLLVGSGLLVRSFIALGTTDPGYRLDGALTFRVSLPTGSFRDNESREAFRDVFFDAIRGLPGVQAVAAVSQLPLTGSGPLQPYAYDERTASNWESVTGDQRYVTPDFFEAMGARLVAGRTFEPSEMRTGTMQDGRNVILVDDRLARQAFPGGDAVGRRLQVNPNDSPEDIRYATVVGVVEHLRLHDLSRPYLTQIWFPIGGWSDRFSVVVRADGEPSALVPAIRAEMGRLAPGAPMEEVLSIRELASASLASDRLALALMTAFGVVALLLASVGLYGVLAYTVSQRTREIGVRMALGQEPAAVRRVVMAEGGRLVVVATVLGLGISAAGALAASGAIYGIAPLDPLTFTVTSGVLLAVATLACWIPARRATRIDPASALRD